MLDSSPDAPYIEIALEEIVGGLQKASLIIDLKTAKESDCSLHRSCTRRSLNC